MVNHSITVFTPTFNRSYCLGNCYNSLCRQTKKCFCWLIIDDGSTDNTKELIAVWIKEDIIPIKYVYQENQGMHGAHNTAYSLITTDYNVCIDSDDYMPDNAIEIIMKNLDELGDRFAGIVGLDADPSGRIIGTKLPVELDECNLTELYHKSKITGDKKLVYRTEVIKEYPKYPIFKGERLVPLSYLYSMIDQDYKLKPVNEILVFVDYQHDGSTNNIFRQYTESPRGFATFRVSNINLSISFMYTFKNAMHLVSCAIFAEDFSLLWKSNRSFLVFLAIPFGVILNMYIRSRIKSML